MDSNPSFFFKQKSFLKNFSKLPAVLLSAVLCIFAFISCSNTAPGIISTDCRLVFDFEDESSYPTQKMNVFLKMDSDVRRTEKMNIYHPESGLRWIVSNPIISQADNYYYAGYTNLQSVPQNKDVIPQGQYIVCFTDAQGREEYSKFEISYDQSYAKYKLSDAVEKIKASEPKIFIAIYSQEGTLLYYGNSRKEWNVTKSYENINQVSIFNQYNESASFRIFYYVENNVFIMPKVLKSDKTKPSEKDYQNRDHNRQNENMR